MRRALPQGRFRCRALSIVPACSLDQGQNAVGPSCSTSWPLGTPGSQVLAPAADVVVFIAGGGGSLGDRKMAEKVSPRKQHRHSRYPAISSSSHVVNLPKVISKTAPLILGRTRAKWTMSVSLAPLPLPPVLAGWLAGAPQQGEWQWVGGPVKACPGPPPARRAGPAEGREGSKLPADDGVMLRRAHHADGQANASEGKRARHASDPLLLFSSGLAVLSLGEPRALRGQATTIDRGI